MKAQKQFDKSANCDLKSVQPLRSVEKKRDVVKNP